MRCDVIAKKFEHAGPDSVDNREQMSGRWLDKSVHNKPMVNARGVMMGVRGRRSEHAR